MPSFLQAFINVLLSAFILWVRSLKWCVPPHPTPTPVWEGTSWASQGHLWTQSVNHVDRSSWPVLQASPFSWNGIKSSSEMVLTESKASDGFFLLVFVCFYETTKTKPECKTIAASVFSTDSPTGW